ncbi:MAG: substrate-binding domain-containing protein [Myxococcales bacterium]|nr:substrate-binding domain-containing protein [Myxococcales bacterium]
MTLERNAQSPRHTARPPGRAIDVNAWAMAGVLVALWAVLALLPATRGVFLTERNLATLLAQNAHILVVAAGMTLVIVIRGIDLSVGAGVALTGVVAALLQLRLGLPAPVAIAAALATGAVIGVWQGWWIARLGIPAFVVTLAGFNAYRGLGLVLSDARGLAPMGADFAIVTASLSPAATWALVALTLAAGVGLTLRDAARRRAHGLDPAPPPVLAARVGGQLAIAAFVLLVFGSRGLPVPVVVAAATVLAGVVLTRRTRFGRHVYAVGGNAEAARLAGVDVRRVTLWVYVLVGVLTGIAGVLLAGRVNGVTPGSQGQLLELDVITAVVIGGTSLLGGRGSVVGTLLGVLVFGTLANGMNLLGVDSNWQLICKGLILMTAVLFDVLAKDGRVLVRAAAIVAALAAVTAALATRTPPPRPQVAFLLSTLQEERYQKDQRYFEARARALGLRVTTLAADNDNARQIAQVEDALTRGARVLVIQPTDSQAASSYVRLAHERGARVVAYDRTIVSPDLDHYVSHDSYRVGVLQAEAAIAATGGRGRYLILAGQAGHSVATEITRGYDETLAPYVARGDIEIVARQSHSAWSPEQAQRTVEDALARAGDRVDAILANNSGMARGAVTALAAAGLHGVFVAGADADAANVNFVCEGKQSVEVLKDIQPLAETAADVAARLLRGEAPAADAPTQLIAGAPVPVSAVAVEVIGPGDVVRRLVDTGFLSASEVPACRR